MFDGASGNTDRGMVVSSQPIPVGRIGSGLPCGQSGCGRPAADLADTVVSNYQPSSCRIFRRQTIEYHFSECSANLLSALC